MVLEYIDILSPRITIYYYGRKRHSSLAGGILTILMILICIIYICYISSELFIHKSPNAQYFRRYMENAGYFQFDNKGGIFHFFQLYNTKNKNFIGNYNKKYIRIIMGRFYDSYQIKKYELSENDHWVYDECRYKDIPNEYKYLINEDTSINNNICIRYFYNSKIKKYIPIDDNKNFMYPYLIYGSSSNKNLYLSAFVVKCNNSSLTSEILGNCAKEEEINEYFENNIGINLFFINHQVDIFNYKNPNNVLLSQIINEFDIINIPICNINFSPLKIRTHKGIIFGYLKEEKSYLFEDNKRTTAKNYENGNIASIFYFWLQNSAQIYDRKYINLLDDILPQIGGIVQTIYYIFFFINKIFNKLKIIKDSMNLIFEWDKKYNIVRSDHNQFSNLVKSLQNLHPSQQTNNSARNRNSIVLNKVYPNSKKRNSYSYKMENNKEIKSNTELNKTFLFNVKTCNQDMRNEGRRKSCFFRINPRHKGLISNNTNININKEEVDKSNINLIFSLKKKQKNNNNDLSENHIKKSCFKNNENNKKINKHEDKKYTDIENNLIENKISEESPVNVNFVDYVERKNSENNKKKEENNINIIEGNVYNNIRKIPQFSSKSIKKTNLKLSFFVGHLTCWDYICSIFCFFKERKNAIHILKQFRKKLLSEEHFFRTNIFLCLAEKSMKLNNGAENVDLIQLYKNL